MLDMLFRTLQNNFKKKRRTMEGQEDLLKYCRAEYGKDWRFAYAEISDHQNKGIGRVIR